MKLVFAEDDPDVSRSVTALLTRSHYSVDPVYYGNDALTYLTDGDYDACIMDIMMPGMNGDDVVRKARAAGSQVPVIMLTAMGEVEDRINGLDAGADDYLAKPFDGGELLARIRALLRRHESYSPDIVTYGDLTLNRSTFALSCHGKSVVPDSVPEVAVSPAAASLSADFTLMPSAPASAVLSAAAAAPLSAVVTLVPSAPASAVLSAAVTVSVVTVSLSADVTFVPSAPVTAVLSAAVASVSSAAALLSSSENSVLSPAFTAE